MNTDKQGIMAMLAFAAKVAWRFRSMGPSGIAATNDVIAYVATITKAAADGRITRAEMNEEREKRLALNASLDTFIATLPVDG